MTTRVFTLNATPPYAPSPTTSGTPHTPHRRDDVPAAEQTRTITPVTENGLAEWFAERTDQQRNLPNYIIGAHCQRVHSTHDSTVEFERNGLLLWTSLCGAAGSLTEQPDPRLAWCSACWDLDNGHRFERGGDGITRCTRQDCGERKIDLVDPITRVCRRCTGGTQ